MNFRIKKIIFSFLLLFSLPTIAVEYTLGGNYRLSGQNVFKDNPSIDLGLGFSGSFLFKEVNELGFRIVYNTNWEKVTAKNIGSKISNFSSNLFYYHHFYITDDSASFPTTFYIGPQVGISEIITPTDSTKLEVIVGATLGSNIFLTQNIAIDIQILNLSTLLRKNSPTIYEQFLGFKFFF